MRIILLILILLFPTLAFPQSTGASAEPSWPLEIYTAKDVWFLDKLEQEVIHELNKVRNDPKRFAEEYMEELRAFFDGKIYTYPGRTPIKSSEGVIPLNECIQILKKTDRMPVLNPSEGLTKASFSLADDQQKHGGIGHISRNGSTPLNRIKRYGEWDICSAEDITYGSFEARQIVIALLIDDGVPDRGHRKNILNPCFHFAGVAFGGHPTYQSMCVIDYAGEYKTK